MSERFGEPFAVDRGVDLRVEHEGPVGRGKPLAQGAEVHHFAPMGEAVDLAQFPDTDFEGLARAAGCHGLTARSLDDLGALRQWLAAPDRPFVLDAKVDPAIYGEWLAEAFRH